ncbi:MAG: phosphotyrosine protein phosphatase [Eubacterium sp.]|nr:phosphotyrosine protein phosphatase [Eubacterium sp.]
MNTYKKIIFADSAGNSRAPMAAELLKECTIRQPLDIQARGIVVLFPEPLNQKAEAVLISNGIVLENYMSSQLEEEDFAQDTLIVVMSNSDRLKILDIFHNVIPENVQVLTELVGEELEIMDPYGGTLQSYGICYETLNKSIKKLSALLNNKNEMNHEVLE